MSQKVLDAIKKREDARQPRKASPKPKAEKKAE
jgi:hypothetical protein